MSLCGVLLFGMVTLAETPEATVRTKLKSVMLSLFPDAHLQTQSIRSKTIVPGTTRHEFKYVLTNVKNIVSEKDMEAYNQHFDEFLLWVKYWDLYYDAKIESTYRGFPSKKRARDDSPSIVPCLKYRLRGEETIFFKLDINFVQEQENTLVAMCNLLLTVPPPKEEPDIQIRDAQLRQSRLDNDRYKYEITFVLTNRTDHAINVATDSFSKTWSGDHGLFKVLLYLRSWNLGDKAFPSLDDIKIVTLRSGDSHPIRDNFVSDKDITGFVLTYRPDDIFRGSGDYWIGSTKTKLIQVER
jgi:hypothetical protein